jgi:hypothetical protein
MAITKLPATARELIPGKRFIQLLSRNKFGHTIAKVFHHNAAAQAGSTPEDN